MKASALCILLIALPCAVWGFGKADTSQPKPVGPEWTVVITSADVSALPLSRAAVGRYWNRELERSLKYIQYRARSESEIKFYKNNEWLRNQTKAAQDIKKKHAERDALYYRGLANWQYKQQLKKIDDDIKKLYEALATAETTDPLVEPLPKFKVIAQNATGDFPAMPTKGTETLFCTGQKADAFITSKISIYHERIYIELQLWTLSSKSYFFTDSIIFSLEDMNDASDEIITRLVDAMTGVYPTMIQVAATPPEAVVVVDNTFAGQGEGAPQPHSPGDAEVMVFAPGYETARATVALEEGDLTTVGLSLRAIPDMGFDVTIKNNLEAAVYAGALYQGEAPLNIVAGEETNMDINVITPDGKTAGAVFKMSEAPLALNPKTQPKKGRVEKSRRGFYGAWGRFWITLPIVWVATGISNSYVNAYNSAPLDGRRQEQFDTAQNLYWFVGGLSILAGVFLVEALGRFLWYGYQADRPVTPLDTDTPPPEPQEAAPPEDGQAALPAELMLLEGEQTAPTPDAPAEAGVPAPPPQKAP